MKIASFTFLLFFVLALKGQNTSMDTLHYQCSVDGLEAETISLTIINGTEFIYQHQSAVICSSTTSVIKGKCKIVDGQVFIQKQRSYSYLRNSGKVNYKWYRERIKNIQLKDNQAVIEMKGGDDQEPPLLQTTASKYVAPYERR